MKVAVLSWGVFGQAIGSLLDYNKVEFQAVDIDKPFKEPVDLVFQMVPTQFVRQAFIDNKKFLGPNTIVVNGAKGIEEKTNRLVYQIIMEDLGYKNYYSLIGPSFASGILKKEPTLVSLGYADRQHIQTILDLLQTPYFRILSTRGRGMLELSSALKNIYAIACGYADGLGFGANTRAKLITLGIKEVVELGAAMDLSAGDVTAPGMVGDMMLSCSSPESRNYLFGKSLASMDQADALKAAGGTVEGYYSSRSIQALLKKHDVELPLASLVQVLIESGADGKAKFHDFVESV